MKKICLNGWWDFYPVYEKDSCKEIPAQGWLEKAYLVPSLWRKPLDCVKTPDEEYFREYRQEDLENIEELQFLYDDFGYPNTWTLTKEAWVRRYFDIECIEKEKQYIILLEAVMPYSALYINGRKISSFVHPTLPYESDVTGYLKKGRNEVIVHIYDYEKDEYGRYMTPTGTMSVADNAGIWQDVFLIERANVYVDDCFVKTYIDDMRIETDICIANSSQRDRNIVVKSYIQDKLTKRKVLVFKDTSLYLRKNDIYDFTVSRCFPDAVLWEPSNPKLYEFIIELYENENEIYKHKVNFGFREIKIEGKHIMLNNKPVHLFSDWGHKVTTYCYTKQWIESWFRMIKDGNMNHTRLHTCPHPSFILDMADETGILITGEAGLHGSGGYQASNSDEYWINAEDHIRRFVKRDRNHPSLILWSVENEMRWNQKGKEQKYPEKTINNLPKLKQLINTMDPTRPAYHEGDSSLWDETKQDIISRHYGKDAVGADWWDQSKPLHIGEMALYHYEGPNTALNLIGDKAYIDHRNVDISSALDAKMIIEYGRTGGVCCFGPWNQSCLKLIRTEKQDRILEYKDFTVPGIKPLNVKAHTSEFAFWKRGKNYTVQKSFDIQKEAFRPFAVIDYSLRNGYFKDELIKRTVYLVNDTSSDKAGTIIAKYGNDIVYKRNISIKKVLEAVSLLDRQGYKTKLILAGQGPHTEEIKRKITELNISDSVEMTGHISDVNILDGLYGLAEILAFPSLYDNSPMVVREAAAMMTPSLLVRSSSASEGITDGYNGYLCEDNSKDIASVLKRVLFEEKNGIRQVGRNAQMTIPVSWDTVIEDVEKCYFDLIRMKKNKRAGRKEYV
jgi:beta-galactosidase